MLFRDIAVNPRLQASCFVLHDLEQDRNNQMAGVCRTITRKLGSSVRVETENDFDHAIADANVVILCISTGGLDAMEHDIEIPKRFGIYQSVGDTTGPGGISRTLRNIPVVVEMARRMEKLCPDAWLINLTNPMSQIVRAITKVTKIRVAGLCHEYHGFMAKLESILGLTDWQRETSATIVGINHFGWIKRLDVRGENGLALLAACLDADPASCFSGNDNLVNFSHQLGGDRVKAELFKIYGMMPYPGDRHIAEFLPHFISEKTGHGTGYGVPLTSIEDRRTKWMDAYRKRIEDWMSEDPHSIPAKPSEEALAPILAALLEGVPTVQPVCCPNEGQVENLPAGAAVETLATFGRNSISPHAAGPLPGDVLGFIHLHCLNQEMTIEAALWGDRRLALKAMIADPLNARLTISEITAMLDELLEANSALLPQFFSTSRCRLSKEIDLLEVG